MSDEPPRLALRASHEAELVAEGRRALLGVVEGQRIADLPEGLPPLVTALVVAAAEAGAPVDPSRLRSSLAVGPVPDVAELAALLRVPVRRVHLTGTWWRDAGLPRLGTFRGQPVAMLPRGRHYVAALPAGGRVPLRGPVLDEVEPIAYTVYPRLPRRPLGVRDLVRVGFLSSRWDALSLAAVTLVLAVVSSIFPYVTAQIIGTVIPSDSRDALTYLLVSLGVFTVVLLLASVAQSLIALGLSSRASARLTAALWDRLLHLPSAFTRRRSAGEIATEVTAFDQMRALVTSSLAAALVGGALAVGGLVVLLASSPAVAAVDLVVLVLVIGTAWWTLRRYRDRLDTSVQERNRLNGLVLGLFAGVAMLRVAGAERRGQALWARGYAFQQQAQREAATERVRLGLLQAALPGALLFGIVIAFGAGSAATVGLTAFSGAVAASSQVALGTAALLTVGATLAQLAPLYRSARPILETAPEVTDDAVPPGEVVGRFQLSSVTFGYVEGRAALHDVSFDVAAGSFVAIVGPSGAGKSTILRLLLGFERPQEGEVLLDGKSLRSLDLEAVRRRMGTVIQGARVTAGSVLSNILGSLPLGVDAAWEAADLAGIAADVHAMPMGMSTVVPEGGAGFSGGQLQRILLARALVRRPRILLLDEATSALDNETQRIVSDRLADLGVTRVVVAHRLSTIRQADRVVVLDHGRVVEQGAPDELAAGHGLYAQLVRRQTL